MIGTLKVKMITDEHGEKRVPPVVFDLLKRFGGHRDVCDDCERAFNQKRGSYCLTGATIWQEILEQPEVQFIQEGRQ